METDLPQTDGLTYEALTAFLSTRGKTPTEQLIFDDPTSERWLTQVHDEPIELTPEMMKPLGDNVSASDRWVGYMLIMFMAASVFALITVMNDISPLHGQVLLSLLP